MRFLRLRKQLYLSRVIGKPSASQAFMADSLARLEWMALVAEREGTPNGDRRGLDARRLHQRLLLDLERSLRQPVPVHRPSLAAHLAARREGSVV